MPPAHPGWHPELYSFPELTGFIKYTCNEAVISLCLQEAEEVEYRIYMPNVCSQQLGSKRGKVTHLIIVTIFNFDDFVDGVTKCSKKVQMLSGVFWGHTGSCSIFDKAGHAKQGGPFSSISQGLILHIEMERRWQGSLASAEEAEPWSQPGRGDCGGGKQLPNIGVTWNLVKASSKTLVRSQPGHTVTSWCLGAELTSCGPYHL